MPFILKGLFGVISSDNPFKCWGLDCAGNFHNAEYSSCVNWTQHTFAGKKKLLWFHIPVCSVRRIQDIVRIEKIFQQNCNFYHRSASNDWVWMKGGCLWEISLNYMKRKQKRIWRWPEKQTKSFTNRERGRESEIIAHPSKHMWAIILGK